MLVKGAYYKVWVEVTQPFPNFSSATVEYYGWLFYFIPHFILHTVTYPCRDQSLSMLIKKAKTMPKYSFMMKCNINSPRRGLLWANLLSSLCRTNPWWKRLHAVNNSFRGARGMCRESKLAEQLQILRAVLVLLFRYCDGLLHNTLYSNPFIESALSK